MASWQKDLLNSTIIKLLTMIILKTGLILFVTLWQDSYTVVSYTHSFNYPGTDWRKHDRQSAPHGLLAFPTTASDGVGFEPLTASALESHAEYCKHSQVMTSTVIQIPKHIGQNKGCDGVEWKCCILQMKLIPFDSLFQQILPVNTHSFSQEVIFFCLLTSLGDTYILTVNRCL